MIAQEAFTYQDPEELQGRAELLGQVHPFFDYDARISSQAQQRLSMAFRAARSSITETAVPPDPQGVEAAVAEPLAAATMSTEQHSAAQLELERADLYYALYREKDHDPSSFEH